jgi:uncharacterized hydantoinase/oxoprolinase family protein
MGTGRVHKIQITQLSPSRTFTLWANADRLAGRLDAVRRAYNLEKTTVTVDGELVTLR